MHSLKVGRDELINGGCWRNTRSWTWAICLFGNWTKTTATLLLHMIAGAKLFRSVNTWSWQRLYKLSTVLPLYCTRASIWRLRRWRRRRFWMRTATWPEPRCKAGHSRPCACGRCLWGVEELISRSQNRQSKNIKHKRRETKKTFWTWGGAALYSETALCLKCFGKNNDQLRKSRQQTSFFYNLVYTPLSVERYPFPAKNQTLVYITDRLCR